MHRVAENQTQIKNKNKNKNKYKNNEVVSLCLARLTLLMLSMNGASGSLRERIPSIHLNRRLNASSGRKIEQINKN
jgi:hypothetical protein